MKRNLSTKCIHLEEDGDYTKHYGAISYPIYQTATYAHPSVGQSTGYDYSRLQNPTREHLEKLVSSLEEGIDALAFSTGMAAINTLMELFKPGDHLIVDSDLYGGSIRLFDHISKKNGIIFTSIYCCRDDITKYINDHTKAVFIETPTNPMMNVTDIERLSRITKVRLIQFAESLGGVETLITYPITQTHADVPADILRKNGITENILRLSVGIEEAGDLITDLEEAFTDAKEVLNGGKKS